MAPLCLSPSACRPSLALLRCLTLALALQSGSQSRSGVVTTQAQRCGQVLVFCESWPVRLFILSVFHLECATVYITDPLPSWLPVLRQCFPDITFSIGCAPSVVPLPPASAWLLLHGSQAWVHQLPPRILQHRCIISFSYMTSVPSYPHICSVESAATGSVVKGRWYFQVPPQFSIPLPDMYARHISHIIDPTTKCATTRPHDSHPSLSVDDSLAWRCSVFTTLYSVAVSFALANGFIVLSLRWNSVGCLITLLSLDTVLFRLRCVPSPGCNHSPLRSFIM